MPVNKKEKIPNHYEKKLKECFQPTEELMAALCNKWVVKVLFALEENDDEPMLFSKIREASGSSSEKMMNQALKTLGVYKLIQKEPISGKTKPYYYYLTNRGRSLLEVLHEYESWVDYYKRDFARDLLEERKKRKK
jgi:DNA-binding HxlR family transcriptional regulator